MSISTGLVNGYLGRYLLYRFHMDAIKRVEPRSILNRVPPAFDLISVHMGITRFAYCVNNQFRKMATSDVLVLILLWHHSRCRACRRQLRVRYMTRRAVMNRFASVQTLQTDHFLAFLFTWCSIASGQQNYMDEAQ